MLEVTGSGTGVSEERLQLKRAKVAASVARVARTGATGVTVKVRKHCNRLSDNPFDSQIM